MHNLKTGDFLHVCQQVRRSMPEALLVLDADDMIVYANEKVSELLGIDDDTVVGCPFHSLWSTTTAVAPPTTTGQYDTIVPHHDGHLVPLTICITSQTQGDKKLVSMMNSVELQRLSDALLHTQRLAGVGTLTASVAHELTNPLSIITTICSNLQHEVEANSLSQEDLLRYVALIEQSAYRSARIVEVLRNYVHLDEPQMAVTDVLSIVRDSLTLVEQQFRKQASVEIDVTLPPNLKTVVCDHNRVTQVLVNLLINARDAMQPKGGTVRVTFWQLPATGEVAEQFAFAVHDSGHGIPPVALERIFDPFFSTKPNGQGTGLGLFIAQGIVRQHHGRIWAENNPEGGATFTVVLPQRQAALGSVQ